MKYLFILFFSILLVSCNNDVDFVLPVIDPGGLLDETEPLNAASRNIMDGIYIVEEGQELFGDTIVIKFSPDKLSLFSGNDGAYGVLKGGSLDSVLYFEGYWRFALNTTAGILRLHISADSGAASILTNDTTDLEILIEGSFGSGDELPESILKLRYLRDMNIPPDQDPFEILAHRGGGRNSDYLGSSENTIEIIKICEGIGATGVELDVRMSRDGVLFLYHDVDINLRLTQKGPLIGKIEDFTWPQIRSLITLINGERIPSLNEALDYILDETGLKTVWLDMKNPAAVDIVVKLQKQILQRAAASNRDLSIYIGLPEEDVVNSFKTIPSFNTIPSLCELPIPVVRELDSDVWAPRWTDGVQLGPVQEMQSEGRKVFVWTLDQPEFIRAFINQGNFNGILSNYPPIVAYYHYLNSEGE